MQKLIGATLILMFLAIVQTNAFASEFNCKFKSGTVDGVDSILVTEDHLIINNYLEIPLDRSRVKCANFGRQTRLDGMGAGFQIILKTCSSEAKFQGHLIDAKNNKAAEVICDEEFKSETEVE